MASFHEGAMHDKEDFVLLDEIIMEAFMENLELR